MAAVRHVLLGLLHQQPDTGYGLSRRLRSEMAHIWRASLQQIYVELSHLEQSGLVSVEVIEPRSRRKARKVYSLTDDGRKKLFDWLGGPATVSRPRDEFLARIWFLAGEDATSAMDRLREQGVRLEAEWRDLSERLSEAENRGTSSVGVQMTLRVSLLVVEAQQSWCRDAVDTLAYDRDPIRSH